MMEAWHRGLGAGDGDFRWPGSGLRPLALEIPSADPQRPLPIIWEIVELTSSSALRAEGRILHHCVASYAWRCRQGLSQIFSIRRQGSASSRPMATVEVDPRQRAVVQARGLRNHRASGKALRLLRAWTARERLRITAM
jgi:hypothetical protein